MFHAIHKTSACSMTLGDICIQETTLTTKKISAKKYSLIIWYAGNAKFSYSYKIVSDMGKEAERNMDLNTLVVFTQAKKWMMAPEKVSHNFYMPKMDHNYGTHHSLV